MQAVLVCDRLFERERKLLGFGAVRLDPGTRQPLLLAFDRFALGAETLPARIVDQTEFATLFGQAQIGIVFAQQQAVFGARGEHAVRLARAQRDQIVDQYADVGFVTTRLPGIAPCARQPALMPASSPCARSLFVTGGAVDLAGEEQSLHMACFQRMLQILRIEDNRIRSRSPAA